MATIRVTIEKDGEVLYSKEVGSISYATSETNNQMVSSLWINYNNYGGALCLIETEQLRPYTGEIVQLKIDYSGVPSVQKNVILGTVTAEVAPFHCGITLNLIEN